MAYHLPVPVPCTDTICLSGDIEFRVVCVRDAIFDFLLLEIQIKFAFYYRSWWLLSDFSHKETYVVYWNKVHFLQLWYSLLIFLGLFALNIWTVVDFQGKCV